MKDELLELRKEGKSYKEISEITGLSKSTISYYIGTKTVYDEKSFCRNCKSLITPSKTYCNNKCQSEYLDKRRIVNLKDGKLMTNETIRRALSDEFGNNCSVCDISNEWNNKPLTLHVDHIDGNSDNNKYDNLRLICPNCHSQLETTKDRSIKYTKRNNYLKRYKNTGLA